MPASAGRKGNFLIAHQVGISRSSDRETIFRRGIIQGQCQAGSLTGAVHLSNVNVGVLMLAQ